ncbi:MAG: ABC transporter ATP-binding protein/permease [Gammaproteobacteria bacterium]|nr:ABC transporter ATP-binding protein/permease [Gammaproteobacteria bacterium]
MKDHHDWKAIRSLLPYIWEFKGRVVLALGLLTLAKLANVGIPIALKGAVDALDPQQQDIIFLPIAMLVTYGLLRLASSLFSELRDALFAKVIFNSVRRIAGAIFKHLHNLSLRFHLQRQTGGISRDIERGSRGISFLLNFMIFNILPTLVEIALVTIILLTQYDSIFAIVTTSTILLYIAYTLVVTEWRMRFRRVMNDMDSKANNQAIDSLLNYETVKYFNNENYELNRYDLTLASWEKSAIKNQTSLSLLNMGQGAIIATGLTILMLLAGQGVVDGELSLGDLVLINAFLLQLYLPLGFLGFVYREIRHSLADMERMFKLLEESQETLDKPDAPALDVSKGEIRFNHVDFHYDSNRKILHDIDFTIEAGKKLAIVGASGSGKSTLARLLFRFYDLQAGTITIDGANISDVQQHSLRQAIGVVPQDTVLFNNTIYHNILYGNPAVDKSAVIEAAKQAHIHNFIQRLPEGYDTLVGERGLKLSGGEKQRVAIARTLLKNPHILIFDEATSALDSHSEKAINKELQAISQNKTTLVIAHRLSTIIDADTILVLNHGKIIERGTHNQLLSKNGHYAAMWALQQSEGSLHV